ncbi:MAG: Gfo/Idh/MocA family protein [Planctomycetaceae bacterium]
MASLNRRQFTSLAAAAAAGVALNTRSSLAQAVSANDTVGVAVIGVNGRGAEHIREFAGDKRVEIRALVDVDDYAANKKADMVAELQGRRPTIYTDMRKVFDSPDVDAISTATPNHWHALCGIWAMQAGKDAYIEKPVCHNITEGRALIETAKKYKRIAQVGTQCRSSTAIRPAIEFLQAGGIGEVKLARGLCYKRRKSIGALGDYPVPESVDFNLWSGPATYTEPKVTRKQFHYDWHWQRHYGNGDLGNQGPHQTDIARWGLGLMRHPNQIISYGGRLGYQAERNDPNYVDAGDTANTCVSIYDYGDKCIVFETRGLGVDDSADEEINKLMGYSRGNKVGVIFYGSEGYLVQESYGKCMAYDKDFKVTKEFKGNTPHFKNFIDAVISRKEEELTASLLEGHLSAAISHLGNISYYLGEKNHVSNEELSKVLAGVKSYDDNLATLGRTIKHLEDNQVDLAKYPISLGPMLTFNNDTEKFEGNDAADAYLTREYRKGFEVPSIDNL